MINEPLKIKKRADDGNKIITVRIQVNILEKLDKLAAESNYSRNEFKSKLYYNYERKFK